MLQFEQRSSIQLAVFTVDKMAEIDMIELFFKFLMSDLSTEKPLAKIRSQVVQNNQFLPRC